MINDPQPSSSVTRCRGMVLINGERAAGLVEFEVDNNGYFQADTFRVVLCLSAQPEGRAFAFWAAQTGMEVELLAGTPQDPDNFTRTDLRSWLTGWVDDLSVDPLRDEIVLTGRDMTGVLVDTKRTVAFTNLRSSDIAIQIAREIGLAYAVTETQQFAGVMASIVKQLLNDRATYWDVLTKLAQFEQYAVFVEGKTLHFEPRSPAMEPYSLQYQAPGALAYVQANFMAMQFARNLTVARGVKVTVLSWNAKTGKTVKAIAQRARVKNTTIGRSGNTGLPPAEYTFTFSGLDQNDAQKKANALLQDISQHEVNLSAELPGDDLLTAQTPVKVTGTGTEFDQVYYPASIQRRFSLDEGYRMSLRARNYSPESQLS